MIGQDTIGGWIAQLSSHAPTPGGGGASALAGALGAALGQMVANLTVGKKRYADVEGEVREGLRRLEGLQADLLALADRDAAVFAPLARAYRMPEETEKQRAVKEQVMQECLISASEVPLEIMEKAFGALDTLDFLEKKGSRMAASDVGVAAQFIRASLAGAVMNVYINTKSMKDRSLAKKYQEKADRLLLEGTKRADEIYENVRRKLCS